MSQRVAFIEAMLTRSLSMRSLCRHFGISEKTGYKWKARFVERGQAGLHERSHAPHVAAHQVARPLIARICTLREAHPTWGARKLRASLTQHEPTVSWPAPSTITQILHREGVPLRRRRARGPRAQWAEHLTTPTAPNDVWAADFKGEFLVQTGDYCYPLTISDLHSRFVLNCTSLSSVVTAPTRASIERTFQEYGLPRVLLTDNGVPFGVPRALGGLSTLTVWWMRLGIRPERIRPGRPQENGRHERMHRTLKAETTRPPAATLAAQGTRFDHWRTEFNHDRPHEALGQTPPAAHYVASPRPYPHRLPPFDYPAHFALRRVSDGGMIKWRNTAIFLSTTLAGEYVGLAETHDATWTIYLGPLQLGCYRDADLEFTEHVTWCDHSHHLP